MHEFDDEPRPRRRYHDEPTRKPAKEGISTVTIVAIVIGVGAALFIASVGIGIYTMMRTVRSTTAQIQAMQGMRSLGDALSDYHSAEGHLPPPYLLTKDGKPGLSWRVEVLKHSPAFAGLYRQFALDEPWDSPTNLRLLSQMPEMYRPVGAPAGAVDTYLRAFVGPGTAFDPSKTITFADITDGTSNTVMAVEAADAVPWTKPEELTYVPNGPLPALGRPKSQMITVLTADGGTQWVSRKASQTTWQAAITRAGNDTIGPDWFTP